MAVPYICTEPCMVKVTPEVICIPENLNDFMTCPAPSREYPQVSTGEPRLLVPVDDMSKLLGIVDFLNNEVALLLSLRDTYKCSREDLVTKNSQLEIEIGALSDHCKKLDERIKFFADEYEDLSEMYCVAKARINALQQQIEISRGGNRWTDPKEMEKESSTSIRQKTAERDTSNLSVVRQSAPPVTRMDGDSKKYIPEDDMETDRHIARSHVMTLAGFSGCLQTVMFHMVHSPKVLNNRKTYYVNDIENMFINGYANDHESVKEAATNRWENIKRSTGIGNKEWDYNTSYSFWSIRNEIARPNLMNMPLKDVDNAVTYLLKKTKYSKCKMSDKSLAFVNTLREIYKTLPLVEGGGEFRGWETYNKSQNAVASRTSFPSSFTTTPRTSSQSTTPGPSGRNSLAHLTPFGSNPSLSLVFPNQEPRRPDMARKREKWDRRATRPHRNQ